MSPAVDPVTATRMVIWGGLVLGLVLGAVGQATRFCVRGGVADWVIFRGPGRLFSWLLAVGVGAVAIQALLSAGLFDASRAVVWGDRYLWLSYLVGGALFGVGMMIAPGCPQRCLVKAGAGDLKALVALVVLAIVGLMTLRGAFAGIRATGLDSVAVGLGSPQDIGSIIGGWLGVSPAGVRWVAALAALGAVLGFAWKVRGRMEPGHWVGGIVVGLLVAAAYYLTGHLGFLAEHPETLEPAWMGTQSRRPEGLSFSAPLAHTLDLLTLWTDRNTVATFGVMLALGVVVGSHLSARWRGEFRVESFTTPQELGSTLGGAVLMGFGGITAVGCSVGNGVTGLAMLSAGSMLAVVGMLGGALAALRFQMRREGASPASAAVLSASA